jgi:hypothetical protein
LQIHRQWLHGVRWTAMQTLPLLTARDACLRPREPSEAPTLHRRPLNMISQLKAQQAVSALLQHLIHRSGDLDLCIESLAAVVLVHLKHRVLHNGPI